MKWRWNLEGVDRLHHGSALTRLECSGVIEGATLAEALLGLVHSYDGLEFVDDEHPFTLAVEPIEEE